MKKVELKEFPFYSGAKAPSSSKFMMDEEAPSAHDELEETLRNFVHELLLASAARVR